jgi:hypothetical protein
MEKEINKLVKKGKKNLLKMCENLGIEASDKDKAKDMAQWILDMQEDVNMWMEAKSNAKEDMKVMKKDSEELSPKKKGVYLGKCVNTGKKLYS